MKFNVLLATAIFSGLSQVSCSVSHWNVTQKTGTILPVEASHGQNKEMDAVIAPYKTHLDQEMATPLTQAPITYDKTGKWNCTVGDLFAHATQVASNPIFKQRTNQQLDGVFLNIGGVRSILPKGQVSLRNAFELMPFENSVCVVPMQKKDIEKLVQFFIDDKKAHPMSGISFSWNADQTKAAQIWINHEALEPNRTYYIATNDYLYNGGDKMTFFKEAGEKISLDYKLRNALIDYFKQTPELPTTFSPITLP